jgi:hypothetical protein
MAHGKTLWSKHLTQRPRPAPFAPPMKPRGGLPRLLAAGHTPAELGYPAELVEKEIVKREWRAWFDAYKSR